MGVVSSAFGKAALSDGWNQQGRGPKLRHIFGAYGIQDCWAVQRRFLQIDDGNGYVSYDELSKLIKSEECSRLFIWDLFNKQNELIDITELLTVIGLFSSAPLEEKARFLLSLYDKAKCSICTGVELGELCTMVLSILARCTGSANPRMKEVGSSLKTELPILLPAYAEAVSQVGVNAAFTSERVVHHAEVKRMVEPIKNQYERLSFSRPPPADSPPPPLPSWGMNAKAAGRPPAKSGAPGHVAAAQRPPAAANASLAAEPHLAWLSRIEEEPLSAASEAAVVEPQRSWLLMYGVVFGNVARDLPAVRQCFMRAASASLGLPALRVEVVNVAPGVCTNSTVLEVMLHPDASGADERPLCSLLQMLDQQVVCAHSALRKGPFGKYLTDAELLAGPPHRGTAQAAADGEAPEVQCTEMATQTDDLELLRAPWPVARPKTTNRAEVAAKDQLRKAFRELDAMRRRTEKAKAAEANVLQVVEQNRALVEALRAELGVCAAR